MSLYQWGFDAVHIGNMKGKEGDSDYLSIVVNVIDSRSKAQQTFEAAHFIGGLLQTGEDVRGPWRTQPIEVRDSDIVVVTYLVTQLFAGQGSTKDALQEAEKVTHTLATDVAPIAGAIAGTILAGNPIAGVELGKDIGEKVEFAVKILVGALVLFDNKGPDCRGEVLHDTVSYAPGEFKRAAGLAAKRTYVGPQTNPDCGKAPTTEVTFSVQVVSTPAVDRQSGVYFQANRDDKVDTRFCVLVSHGDRIVEYGQPRLDEDGNPPLAWAPTTSIAVPATSGADVARTFRRVSAFQSAIFGIRNIEALAHDAPQLLRPGVGFLRAFFQDGARISDPSVDHRFNDIGPIVVGGGEITGITGTPAWIQGTRGGAHRLQVSKPVPPIIVNGNFELVVPNDRRLRHFWRDNESGGLPSWNEGIEVPVPDGFRPVSVALMESNFENLELVVHLRSLVGTQDFVGTYFLKPGGTAWHGPEPVLVEGTSIGGVTGQLAWAQSQDAHRGNFELVVPIAGKIHHFTRDLDADGFPWRRGAGVPEATFVTEPVVDPATGKPIDVPTLGSVEATGVSVFRSKRNNLEMLAHVQVKAASGGILGDRLVTYSLQPGETTWEGPTDVLLFGGKNNFISGVVGL